MECSVCVCVSYCVLLYVILILGLVLGEKEEVFAQ